MRTHRRLVVLAATAAAVVAVPTAAQAHQSPSVKTVSSHAAKADKALIRLHLAVDAGNGKSAAKQLKIARKESAAAGADARKMAKGARGSKATRAAQANTISAEQYDQLLETLATLVDEIKGKIQTLIADALKPALQAKQQAIAILTSLLDVVPEPAKPILQSVIAALSAGDATEVTELQGALNTPGGLPGSISGIVSSVLGSATAAIDAGFETVKSILPLLPEVVRGPLTSILGQVQQTVGTLVPSVLSMVTGIIDTAMGSLPFIGAAGGGFGLGQLLGGIVGKPKVPGSDQELKKDVNGAGAGPIGGLADIFIGILNSITETIGGLLKSLLGNFLGGFLGGGNAPAAAGS